MGLLKGKHIILGICGGIAAYKSVYLLRLLVKAGGGAGGDYAGREGIYHSRDSVVA